MSVWTSLLPRTTRRSPAAVRRDLLELDAGALLTPTDYPYGPGRRPVRPFGGRVAIVGRGERQAAQLFPITGNPTQRATAHVNAGASAPAGRYARGDVAGNRQPAKITRRRPWLFAGGSSATAGDRATVTAPATPAVRAAGPCVGCG